jgi:hypothetical protein
MSNSYRSRLLYVTLGYAPGILALDHWIRWRYFPAAC